MRFWCINVKVLTVQKKYWQLSAAICQAPVGNSLKSIITGMHRDGKRRKEAGGSERYEEHSIGVNKEVSKTTKSKREMREEKRRTAAIAVYRLEVPVFVGNA